MNTSLCLSAKVLGSMCSNLGLKYWQICAIRLQAPQRSAALMGGCSTRSMAVLDLKRATAIGVRMARMRCEVSHCLKPERNSLPLDRK